MVGKTGMVLNSIPKDSCSHPTKDTKGFGGKVFKFFKYDPEVIMSEIVNMLNYCLTIDFILFYRNDSQCKQYKWPIKETARNA